MGKVKTVSIQCPHCGKRFKTHIEKKVEARHESSKAALISGSLFKEECPYCHEQFDHPYTVSYKDPIHYVTMIVCGNEQDYHRLSQKYKNSEEYRVYETLAAFNAQRPVFEAYLDDRVLSLEEEIFLQQEGFDEVRFYVKTDEYGLHIPMLAGVKDGAIQMEREVEPLYDFLEPIVASECAEKVDDQYELSAEKLAALKKDGWRKHEETINFVKNQTDQEKAASFIIAIARINHNARREIANLICRSFDTAWHFLMRSFHHRQPTVPGINHAYQDGFLEAVTGLIFILKDEKQYDMLEHMTKTLYETIDFRGDAEMERAYQDYYEDALFFKKAGQAS